MSNTSENSASCEAVEVQQIDRKYECPICLNFLKDPILTSCGHHFCNDCIRVWLSKKSDSCPIDGQKLTDKDLFPDQFTRREIMNTKTFCPICQLQLSPVELENHKIDQHQSKQPIDCMFRNVGCMAKISQDNMAEHMTTEIHHHMNLMNNAYLESSKLSAQQRDTEVLNQETEFWDPAMKNGSSSSESDSAWKPLMRSMYERVVVLQQRSYEQENLIKNLNSALHEANSKLQDVNLKYAGGQYLWTLNNFTDKLTSMQTDKMVMFYSPGFYTSPVGYKVCARLNMSPNQPGQISLLLHIMKSSHDFALEWPFTGRITLALIHPHIPDFTVKETMMSRPELDAFQKPIYEFNTKSFGYTEFISIQEILSKGYLQNDCLHIKIIVQCV